MFGHLRGILRREYDGTRTEGFAKIQRKKQIDLFFLRESDVRPDQTDRAESCETVYKRESTGAREREGLDRTLYPTFQKMEVDKWRRHFRRMAEGKVIPNHKGHYIVSDVQTGGDSRVPDIRFVTPVARDIELAKSELNADKRQSPIRPPTGYKRLRGTAFSNINHEYRQARR